MLLADFFIHLWKLTTVCTILTRLTYIWMLDTHKVHIDQFIGQKTLYVTNYIEFFTLI